MAKTETACGLLKAAVLQRVAAEEPMDERTLKSVTLGIQTLNAGDEEAALKLLVKLRDENAMVDANNPRLDPKARPIIKRVRKFVQRAEQAAQSRARFIETLAAELAGRKGISPKVARARMTASIAEGE